MAEPRFVRPAFLFAYANDRVDDRRYLRNLPDELRANRAALEAAEAARRCDAEHRPNATLAEVIAFCQEAQDRLHLFHFAGHADGKTLLFEERRGAPDEVGGAVLATFLGTLGGLKLVFLNGCATREQVGALRAANVSAVIATTTEIRDEAATSFSAAFYAAIAAGRSVQVAFDQARAATSAKHGGALRRADARRGVVPSEPEAELEPAAPRIEPGDLWVIEGERRVLDAPLLRSAWGLRRGVSVSIGVGLLAFVVLRLFYWMYPPTFDDPLSMRESALLALTVALFTFGAYTIVRLTRDGVRHKLVALRAKARG